MQEYKRIDITKDEIVPIAERMRKKEVYLVMIHGFLDKEGRPDISYEYAVGSVLESYHVVGETVLPSISGIYESGRKESSMNSSAGLSKVWMFPNVCSCRMICWRMRGKARSWSNRSQSSEN